MAEITIDGKSIPFTEGQSIMEAAEQAGVYIPHLCHRSGYPAHGSCRLCTVKVNGHWVSACTEPAQNKQLIENDEAELQAQRREIIQLLFAEGNHYCPFCEKSGNCQLQAVAYALDMHDAHFTHQFPKREIDASHPEVLLDRDRCIQCELCVRASHEKDGKNVFALSGRGPHTKLIINSASGKLKDSDIDPDDEAIKVCPTGALMRRTKPFAKPIGERDYDRVPIHLQPVTHVQRKEETK